MIKEMIDFLNDPNAVFWIFFAIAWIILTEIIFVHFVKTVKRSESKLEYTIIYKSMSAVLAVFVLLLAVMLFIGLMSAILVIIEFWIGILIILLAILLIGGYIGINYIVVDKLGTVLKHSHNFKRGDILISSGEGRYATSINSEFYNDWELDQGEEYKFVKNLKHDTILVKSSKVGPEYKNQLGIELSCREYKLELKNKKSKKK